MTARGAKEAVSVSDSHYPGNEADRPRLLAPPVTGVVLWWCPLVADDDTLPRLASWLSPEEHARASRFGRPFLARRYIVGRAALRFVLAGRLGTQPAAVPIEHDSRGRPRIAIEGTPDFNVTNTGDAAMFGLVEQPNARIGVDLEPIDRHVNDAGLSRRVCTAAERQSLDALGDEARRHAFLRLWTCKEAMCKATGEGFAAPFDEIDVAREPELALIGGPPPYRPGAWTLLDASVPEGFVGTVALWLRGDESR
jgi:4'-phosphopantetheinyl transferase